jgi:hypothetical protein
VASRAPGEGGRGAGFIACATVRGIVGMLHEEMTGPGDARCQNAKKKRRQIVTCVVPTDRSLHNGLHPIPHDSFLVRRKVVRLVVIVIDAETVLARVDVLVDGDLVADDMNVPFYLRELPKNQLHQSTILSKKPKLRTKKKK